MAKERKIRCDCGAVLQAQKILFDHIEADAMVCPKCRFTTLTRKQAEQFVELKKLHDIVDAERKIIRIGNSMGLTLPDKIKDFGAKVGSKVKIEALNGNSFKVELIQ